MRFTLTLQCVNPTLFDECRPLITYPPPPQRNICFTGMIWVKWVLMCDYFVIIYMIRQMALKAFFLLSEEMIFWVKVYKEVCYSIACATSHQDVWPLDSGVICFVWSNHLSQGRSAPVLCVISNRPQSTLRELCDSEDKLLILAY